MYDADILGLYLHKVAVMPCLPTGIVILLLVAGFIFHLRWLVGVALLVFWLASTPVVADYLRYYVEWGIERVKVMDAPKVDVIVVLSGDSQRRDAGIELYKAGAAPVLMFTGGWAPWSPDKPLEGDVSLQHALSLGVPPHALRTTGRVMHTAAEAEAVRKELEKMNPAMQATELSILLLMSPAHMERARILFTNAGMRVSPFPVGMPVKKPVVRDFLDFVPRADAFAQTEAAWRELCGQWMYGLSGVLTRGGS
jgi:uncharacterized SAM-binding protein YcdF (DUF218 family)